MPTVKVKRHFRKMPHSRRKVLVKPHTRKT